MKSEIFAYFPSFVKAKKCAEILTSTTNGEVQAKDNADYDEIMHWKKNLFKVPSGKSAKNFILELAQWLEHYNTKSDYQNIALKVFMILPALLQKPSKISKAKDHSNKLEIRFQFWKDGNILDLLREGRTIQERLRKIKETKVKFY